jgi:hypothetical protein
MKPALKPPRSNRLKLTYYKLLSNVAFKINLRRYSLVAADFDSLPGVRVSGRNAPLVASQEPGGRSVDHDSYLDNPGGWACRMLPSTFSTHCAPSFPEMNGIL